MPGVALQRLAVVGRSGAHVVRPGNPSTHRPSVSVVIPCYNYGRFLEGCVESVLNQPGVDVDVLVIDDASGDESADVARRLVAGDPRVRVAIHERNVGHLATFNEGLEEARGEYAVLLSADDLLTPGALARATHLMDAVPSVGFVYGNCAMFDQEPLPKVRVAVLSWTLFSGKGWIVDRCRRGVNTIQSSEVVMRTDVLRQVGAYRLDLPHTGDFELWMRAATVADVGLLGGVDQAFHRSHSGSMSQTHFSTVLTDIQERARAFDAFFDTCGAELPDSEVLRDRANRTLAREAIEYALVSLGRATVDAELVDGYIAFAAKTWPQSIETRDWRALTRRRARRSRWFRCTPPFLLRDAAHDLKWRFLWRRQRRTGL